MTSLLRPPSIRVPLGGTGKLELRCRAGTSSCGPTPWVNGRRCFLWFGLPASASQFTRKGSPVQREFKGAEAANGNTARRPLGWDHGRSQASERSPVFKRCCGEVPQTPNSLSAKAGVGVDLSGSLHCHLRRWRPPAAGSNCPSSLGRASLQLAARGVVRAAP